MPFRSLVHVGCLKLVLFIDTIRCLRLTMERWAVVIRLTKELGMEPIPRVLWKQRLTKEVPAPWLLAKGSTSMFCSGF